MQRSAAGRWDVIDVIGPTGKREGFGDFRSRITATNSNANRSSRSFAEPRATPHRSNT